MPTPGGYIQLFFEIHLLLPRLKINSLGYGLKGGVNAQRCRPLKVRLQVNEDFENLHFQIRERTKHWDTWAAHPVYYHTTQEKSDSFCFPK